MKLVEQGWVSPLLSPDSVDRLTVFHRFVILKDVIHEVWDLKNTVNRKCIMALSNSLDAQGLRDIDFKL